MERRLYDVLHNNAENYILPFYWQHGEDESLIAEGMEKIRESNIRAVCVEARPHPDFVGPKWWKDMDVIMQKAKELGMKVWVLDDSHFPTGRCNDKITEDSPYRKFVLTHYTIDMVGPMKNASFIVNLDKNETFIGAVAARIHEGRPYYQSEIQDITKNRQGDVLEWDVPEGYWSVTIIKVTDKHTARQGYANLIDREATRFLIDTVYEPHYERYGKDFGDVFAGFFSDEPELGNTFRDITGASCAGVPNIPLPWCSELEEKLQELWGDDYCKNLSILWYTADEDPASSNISGKVRKEYTDIVTRLYQKNFCEQIGDWCREHGVMYIGHIIEGSKLGVGVGHYFRGLWGQDMSGVDIVLQQLRPQMDHILFHRIGGINTAMPVFSHYALGKLASSLAHIDPKKKGRALCENFGAYGWTEGVKLMKWLTDHMLVRGVNYYVPHAFTMKDFPDPDCPPHFYARGKNPQYPYFGMLMEYLNRISHLIDGGVHHAKVGVLYSADLEWMERDTMQFDEPAMILTQHQVDFDILPIDVVTESRIEDGVVYSGAPVYEDGELIGQEYIKTLVIPECRCYDRKFADWCEYAIRRGVTIISLNALPKILEEDGRLSDWKDVSPEVVSLEALGELLRERKLGLEVSQSSRYLRYYHYQHKDGSYYLFFNESVTDEIQVDVRLEAGDSEDVAEYDAWDNCLKIADYNQVNQMLSLKLEPYEMKVIAVGSFDDEIINKKSDKNLKKTEIHPEWALYLKQTEEAEFVFDSTGKELKNVTAASRHPKFCGTMKYVAEICCDHVDDITAIDFGEVYETAKLRINGKEVGVRITPPYRFEISGLLQEGMNTVELEVTNTLVHQVHDRFSLSMPVEPSGLLGPVYIYENARVGGEL